MSLAVRLVAALTFGAAVSFFNHWLGGAAGLPKTREPLPPRGGGQGSGRIQGRYALRQLINVAALLVVFLLDKTPAVLLAAGIGLLTARNVMLASQLRKGREGP